MSGELKCNHCGRPIRPEAGEAVCPHCLLGLGLDAGEEEAEGQNTASSGPASEDGGRKTENSGQKSEGNHAQTAAAPPPGTIIRYFGDYELLGEAGRGAMGVVYKARQVSLDRIVAVKMILSGPYATEAFIKRFETEAKAAGKLKHPNIVSVHEVGEYQGQHYFSMDFIDGPSLAEVVHEKPLPAKQAARYAQIIAEAIHFAHRHHILHRDLKPSNVLIDADDQPRITDFGLAKQLDVDSTLSSTGHLLGTPPYMPPEQIESRHGELGPHSDVYSIGATLYHLLTGRPPFEGENLADLLEQVRNVDPVAPRRLNAIVPRDLETICLKCLQKRPSGRYPSAQELADDVRRFLSYEPIRARSVSRTEKAWRWCQRKPALAGLSAAFLVAVTLGLAGIVWQAVRATRAEQTVQTTGKPVITEQPQSRTVSVGQTVTLSVSTRGILPMTYQWRLNGADLPTATNATLTVKSMQRPNVGAYSVIVSNQLASVVSAEVNLAIESIHTWGWNYQDSLRVPPGLGDVVAIGARQYGGTALKRNGTLVIWPSSPTDSRDATNVTSIVGGIDQVLALKADGRLAGSSPSPYGMASSPAGLSDIVAVSSGGEHSVVLRADGTVYAWGGNSSGQLNVPHDLTNVVAIATSRGHTLALKADGTVVAWGDNGRGQTEVPSGLSDVVAIAAGYTHSLALKADGTVAAWGAYYVGWENAVWPIEMPPELRNVVAIAGGDFHSLALEENGRVVAWGKGWDVGQYTVPPGLGRIVAIDAGANSNMALEGDGAPYLTTPLLNRTAILRKDVHFRVAATGAWPLACQWNHAGTNIPGATRPVLTLRGVGPEQAGLYSVTVTNPFGEVTSRSAMLAVLPLQVLHPPHDQMVCQGKGVLLTCSVDSGSPTSFQWLWNSARVPGATNASFALTNVEPGQAGVYLVEARNAAGRVQSRGAIVTVKPLLVETASQGQNVPAGGDVTFTTISESALPVNYQWLRGGQSIPDATNSFLTLRNVQVDQTGAYSVIARNAYGEVISPEAQLSLTRVVAWGDNAYGQTKVPLDLTNVVAVGACYMDSWALTAAGRIIGWGGNRLGESNIPAEATNIAAIAAGGPLALRADGKVIAWRDNGFGQLNLPEGLTNIAAVASGGQHHVVLRANGSVLAWGYKDGRLDVPDGLSNVVAIAAGGSHTLALKSDGTVIAWGRYWTGNRGLPVYVPRELNGVVAIAAGSHDLALKADGTVVAWGLNGDGQCDVPPGLTDVVAIAASEVQSLALRRNGTVVAWGIYPSDQRGGPAPGAARLRNVVAIACGYAHSVALLGDGRPTITLQPFTQTVRSGGSVVLRTWAVGSSLKHQWRFDGAEMRGETNKTLALTNVRLEQRGSYQDVVSNSQGGVTSRVAHVFVLER